jgi:hypothetical protein
MSDEESNRLSRLAAQSQYRTTVCGMNPLRPAIAVIALSLEVKCELKPTPFAS